MRIVQVVQYDPSDNFLVVLADDGCIWQWQWKIGGEREWVCKDIPPIPETHNGKASK